MESTPEHQPLKNFPISFFAIVMGLSGFAIALSKGGEVLGLPPMVGNAILLLAFAVFAAITLLYLMKLARYRSEVVKELHHPIKLSFFPASSISLILFSIATLHIDPMLSKVLWSVGTAIQLAFTLFVMSRWIHHSGFEIQHITPAWFIPIVGNILVPIAGVHHFSPEISWFFFSLGLLFWIVLLTIFFYRIIFHHPIAEKLVPTFFILIAPPAVGFISYVALNNGLDNFARVLYYVAMFFVLLLVTQFRMFTRISFFLSWWAYSFPVAAFTIASMLMFQKTGNGAFYQLSWLMLGLLTVLITLLGSMTINAISRKKICVEE